MNVIKFNVQKRKYLKTNYAIIIVHQDINFKIYIVYIYIDLQKSAAKYRSRQERHTNSKEIVNLPDPEKNVLSLVNEHLLLYISRILQFYTLQLNHRLFDDFTCSYLEIYTA